LLLPFLESGVGFELPLFFDGLPKRHPIWNALPSLPPNRPPSFAPTV
jgi:hypothetical protein